MILVLAIIHGFSHQEDSEATDGALIGRQVDVRPCFFERVPGNAIVSELQQDSAAGLLLELQADRGFAGLFRIGIPGNVDEDFLSSQLQL